MKRWLTDLAHGGLYLLCTLLLWPGWFYPEVVFPAKRP